MCSGVRRESSLQHFHTCVADAAIMPVRISEHWSMTNLFPSDRTELSSSQFRGVWVFAP